MSWGDWYKQIWDDLVAKVIALDDFDAEHVFYGEKFPPSVFPSAFVCPGEALSRPATFKESFWNPTFEIGVVVKNPDTKAGFIEVFKLVGKIIDAIEADRQLSNTVHNSECIRVVPYWRGLGRGLEVHWVGVIVRTERKR